MNDFIDILKNYWWIISTFILPILTYFVGVYKKKNKDQDEKIKNVETSQIAQREALKILLQAELTNKFYKYIDTGEIPSYAYKNWINLLNAYEKLGGNDYIHELASRIKKLKIVNK